jgi:hypothetical protein
VGGHRWVKMGVLTSGILQRSAYTIKRRTGEAYVRVCCPEAWLTDCDALSTGQTVPAACHAASFGAAG